MSPEVPLQYNFTGELMDNRTHKQKRLAKRATGWQQAEMFSQRNVAQFGVRPNPEMLAIVRDGKPLRMTLRIQDPRTEEEKATDRQREAGELTDLLWPDGDADT